MDFRRDLRELCGHRKLRLTMPSIHTFNLPALPLEAIGAHLPTFRQKIAACPDDCWDISRNGDGYAVRCSPEIAMTVARLLQAVGRSPIASVEKMTACIGGASLIITQLKREGER
jgi:hypothetical protein